MTTATMHETDQIAKGKSDILALLVGMSKANHDKNAAAFAGAFAEDAAVFNLAPPLIHDGIDRKEKQAWFDGWDGPVGIESRDFKVTVDGDHAFAYGYLRLHGKKKGVEQPIDFWMRETLCLERKGDGWKIVHEHTSVPFYMDASLRPAFDLKPE